jgi:hypothetical protein
MLPERINAIKTVTYDVTQIVESLQAMNDDDTYEPAVEDVLQYIEDWVYEDLGGDSGVIFQDENGEELPKMRAGGVS